MICAVLWMGSWWRVGWGGIKLEGEDLGLEGETREQENERLGNARSDGEAIEGRPVGNEPMRRSTAISWKDGGKGKAVDTQADTAPGEAPAEQGKDKRVLLTLALLRTLHTMTTAHLSLLAELLPPLEEGPQTIYLSARDVASLGLGAWSTSDAKYIEWLAEKWGDGRKVVVRRNWKDLAWFAFGFS
jgi:hypothetical protein